MRAHDTLEAACAHLRERGFQLVAAHLGDEAKDYRTLDYTRPTALVVGTELFGVSEAALAEADQQVKIPMMGVTRSLNVSDACAIVLYEAMRQRQAAGMYGQNRLDDALLRQQRFEWLHPKLPNFAGSVAWNTRQWMNRETWSGNFPGVHRTYFYSCFKTSSVSGILPVQSSKDSAACSTSMPRPSW